MFETLHFLVIKQVINIEHRACFIYESVINEKGDWGTGGRGENRFPRVHLGCRPYRLSSISHQARSQSRSAGEDPSESLCERKTKILGANYHQNHAGGTDMEARERGRAASWFLGSVWSQMALRNTARHRRLRRHSLRLDPNTQHLLDQQARTHTNTLI